MIICDPALLDKGFTERKNQPVIACDIFNGYADANKFLEEIHSDIRLSDDDHVEHHDILVVGSRKWCYTFGKESYPDFWFLRYEYNQTVHVSDKYDIFIYTRG